MGRALRTLLAILTAWLMVIGAPTWAAEPDNADIRVLIDISGSMKQNDPQNLRRPALRMLVGLLQPGTEAGVWTFAKYAAELVQPGPVDEAWKRKALAASEKINSPGMFTNIERVMQRAIRQWEGSKPTHRRNLLLLTDGVVDISKNKAESAASRRRILEQLVPQIRAMDAKIHTIALSARADHDLLEQLARETGGWYQQIETADELQRVFLRLFEQAGKPTGVPLKNNKFQVDNTIREATVLLFRSPDAEPPRLTSPTGKSFGRDDAPVYVTWHQDTGYDLITVRDPESGEWSLTAEIDPDNRVMVVTDLKLRVSEVPARIAVGDTLPVTAFLTNDGHLITRRAFLDLVEMRAETVSDIGLAPQPLNDKGQKGDVKSGDGRYSMKFTERQPHAELDLIVAAESATFLREQRHVLSVLEPAKVRVVKDDGGAVVAEMHVDRAVMRLDGAQVTLWQQTAAGEKQAIQAVSEDAGAYRAPIDPSLPVFARLVGVSRLGTHLDHEYGPIYAPGTEPVAVVAEQPVTEAAPALKEPAPTESATEEKGESPPVVEEAPVEDEGTDWVVPTVIFGGVNVLLLLGGVAFWLIRRKRRGAVDDLDLLGDEPIQVAESEAPAGAEAGETAPDADSGDAAEKT